MAASKHISSLSAGALIRAILLDDPDVRAITGRVIPVATPQVEAPYILYGRSRLEPTPQKGRPALDTVEIVVDCITAQYGQGVQLAEAVRAALDYSTATDEAVGLYMGSCTLVDASEDNSDDAFVQSLTFSIKIGPIHTT